MWDIRGFWHSCSCSSSPPASPPSWPPCPPTPPPRPTRLKWSSSPRPCSPGSWAGRRDWSTAGRLQLRPGRSELWAALCIDSNASMRVLTPGVAMINFQKNIGLISSPHSLVEVLTSLQTFCLLRFVQCFPYTKSNKFSLQKFSL